MCSLERFNRYSEVPANNDFKNQGSAIDVVINHPGARDKLINTISKINKEQIGQLLYLALR
jgi:hypothetical protein